MAVARQECTSCGCEWGHLRRDDAMACASCKAEARRRREENLCSLCGQANRRKGKNKTYCVSCHVKYYGWGAWRGQFGTGSTVIVRKAPVGINEREGEEWRRWRA